MSAPCPACGGPAVRDVFACAPLPVNVGMFHETREAALAAPRGEVTLAWCSSCDFVHNRRFDPDGSIFEPGYEVALHHSQTFRDFITGVADGLIERFDLQGKRVLEIGCGDAYFLRLLAEKGGNDCTGIDPTVREEGDMPVERGRVRLVRDMFGPAHGSLEANFVCSLSVFEDIPRPATFLEALRLIAARGDAPVYLEVFNAWRAFEAREVWSVHYEQCNYFGLGSLHAVLEANGFRIERSGTCYAGDQYLFAEMRAGEAVPAPGDGAREAPDTLRGFADAFEQRRASWDARLSEWHARGERVVLWGTGGKGITFLNSVPAARHIEFVAEINPDKQGRYVPGTGQRIVAPEALAQIRPQHVVITNALYRDEMEATARALGVDARFTVA